MVRSAYFAAAALLSHAPPVVASHPPATSEETLALIDSYREKWIMGGEKQESVTVVPFECAWREELRFREAERGCVAFEAFAQNDVTLVFREQVGSQHYHYQRDNSPNYTVILGSHRNRRLRIEVDGKTVVDVAGTGLCCSSGF